MYSMTGYGKAEYADGGVSLTVEIKSVNNRNFDFNAKTPRAFFPIEDKLRKTVQDYISRGRIELFINYKAVGAAQGAITVDYDKAAQFFSIAKNISEKTGAINDCTASVLMRMADVITDETSFNAEGVEEAVIETLKEALARFDEMRLAEGEKLVADMLNRLETVSSLVASIRERAPLVSKEYAEKLRARIEEALSGVSYDEAKLLSEVAFFVDRSDITEELTRLDSHIGQFKNIVKQEKSGKKLDFLMQEFNREANTVCSKSNDKEVTAYALSLKNEIEKIREQVQNLE